MATIDPTDGLSIVPAAAALAGGNAPRDREHCEHPRPLTLGLGSAAALVTGLLSAFAFEPVGWWPLMLLAFAMLAELVASAPTLRRALLTGWLFGVGQFVLGFNWIATAFTYQAAMPDWLGWIAVVLLSFYLAVYPLLATGLAWRFGQRSRIALVLALAGGWALSEYLRATMFTGFAWNPVGVTLVETPWRASAHLLGTYGLSMLVVLSGGTLWLLARGISWRFPFAVATMAALLLAWPSPTAHLGGDAALKTFDAVGAAAPVPAPPPPPGSTAPAPPPTPPSPAEMAPPPPIMTPAQIDEYLRTCGQCLSAVRVVQPNIGQEDKWRPGLEDEAFARLAQLSTGGDFAPRLLMWPEVAVPVPFQILGPGQQPLPVLLPGVPRALQSLRVGDTLVTGAFALTSNPQGRVVGNTNSVFAIDSRGRVVGRYDKAHLVPYGEYLPMRPVLTAIGLSQLAPGVGDTIPGPGPRTIPIPGWGKMGVQICYEIIFSGEVVDRANRPDYIFNPSNDAWFGAWGPPQHLAQARLRAAEEGLPVIRSTPTGISALVDARGELIKSIPWRKAGAFDGAIPPRTEKPTLFGRLGNALPLSLAFLLLITAIGIDVRRRYRRVI
ncbi:MAG TPA: apolipoprotein N-acyltransferase [Sphingomicrobium sp.]|jgi:apolipoprotein N-acyltransferase|nr:apolipoprotein N-acyltransferase [Sphingomicrobium sp.]